METTSTRENVLCEMPPELLPSVSSPGISILRIILERTHFSPFLPTQHESFKGKGGGLFFAAANLPFILFLVFYYVLRRTS